MTVISSGFYDSVQDRGRVNYRHIGVPQSGAMDQRSADLGNSLLNNPLDAAVVEVTLKGGTYVFSYPTSIAVTGAIALVSINDVAAQQNKLLEITVGDVLKIGVATTGNFIYIAIAGGFQAQEVLGSKSFYTGITLKSKLAKGDHVNYVDFSKNKLTQDIWKSKEQESALRCYAGPEFHLLDLKQQEKLLITSFAVSKNWNRMAFQLAGKIPNTLRQLKSSPVLPGTVQLTASGQLIVLMRDAQTTGGYPRVLQLEEIAVSRCAQKRVGEQLGFIVL